jgi:predicted  nucleic acid-binding Zn-ribbon protein
MLSSSEAVNALLELHQLEDKLAQLKRKDSGPTPAKIKEVRSRLPEQILSHHDRMRIKGKRSVAVIRENWVCGGCFLVIPIGERAGILAQKDVYLCQTCGRFLYPDAGLEKTTAPEPLVAPKTAPASSRRGTGAPRKKALKVARLTT